MPVHVTRRRSGFWYAAGTVRAGGQSVTVDEYSTGCRARIDAEAVASKRDREERDRLIEGGTPPLMIAECFTSYLGRPGGVKAYDVARLLDLNKVAGDTPLSAAPRAWQRWLAERGAGQMPSSVARWRNTFQAALNHGAAAHGMTAPKLPGVRGAGGVDRAVYLTEDERARLLAAYNPHAGRVALVLAYQGMRSQEALQLDWRNVDLWRRTIHIRAVDAKSGKARTVPMHRRVRVSLYLNWRGRERPKVGPVFLSSRGAPYADTRGRGDRAQGGNPLTSAHETACRRSGIEGFRVHDWRHDFAARMIMSGCDTRTLMDLCGWSSPRMITRYAWITAGHAAQAIGRLR